MPADSRPVPAWLVVFGLLLAVLAVGRLQSQTGPVDAWPTYQHDAQHTGSSSYSGPLTNNGRSIFDIGPLKPSSPVLGSNGLLHFVKRLDEFDFEVLAVTRDGTPVLQTPTLSLGCRGSISPPTVLEDGSFYVIGGCNAGEELFGFDSAGQPIWRLGLAGGASSMTPAPDGTLYVNSGFWQNAQVALRNLRPDGTELWRYDYDFLPGLLNPPAVARTGEIVVTAIGQNGAFSSLEAHDPTTGQLMWRHILPNSSPASPPMIGEDDTAYFTSGGSLYAWPTDGSAAPFWSIPLGTFGYTSTPSLAPDGSIRVLTGLTGLESARLHSISSLGVLQWQRDLAGGQGQIPPGEVAVDNNGNSFVALSLSCALCPVIFGVDHNGTPIWEYSALTSTPLNIGDDGILYASLHDGTLYKLYAIGDGGTPPSPTPTINSALPASGPTTGGTLVTITGTQFVYPIAVRFGDVTVSNSNITFVDSMTLQVVTPPHAAGPVDVTVTNPDGRNATLPSAFIYFQPCTYAISPTVDQSYSAAGGTGVVAVHTTAACSWNASSNVPWIAITSGSAGSGNGTLTYSVEPNDSTLSRSGAIIVATIPLTVTQDSAVQIHLAVDDRQHRTTGANTSSHPLGELPLSLIDSTTGQLVASALTDAAGNVTVPIPSGQYNVIAHLRHERPLSTVLLEIQHDDRPVAIEWPTTDLDGSSPVLLRANDHTARSTDPTVSTARLTDLALTYVHTKQVVDFYRDSLAVQPLLLPTLSVRSFNTSDAGVHYHPVASATVGLPIHEVHIEPQASMATYEGRPMHREWHETFHELMDETLGIDIRPVGDTNHGGYLNGSTADSWVEGWASFFPSVLWRDLGLPQPHLYRMGGYPIDLERNWKAWEAQQCGLRYRILNLLASVPCIQREDFAVASLLWDVVDPIGVDEDDFIYLSLDELWSVIGQSGSDLVDMKDVYDAFVNGVVGQGDTDHNGISDLDALYIAHGFFVDTDGDRVHDDGEEVGRAADDTRTDRRQPPMVPGAYLDVRVVDESGAPILQGELVFDTAYSADSGVPGFQYRVDLLELAENGNRVYFEPPPMAEPTTISIYAELSGDVRTDRLDILNTQYWSMLERSVSDSVARVTLTAGESGSTVLTVADIEPQTILRGAAGQWLTWRVELPPGLDPALIDPANVSIVEVSGMALETPIPAESRATLGFVRQIEITDIDDDGLLEGMVRFRWSDVSNVLPLGAVDLVCAGELPNGVGFIAKGTVRVTE